jgi:prolyl-tRNA editing enzyme YbaK/EbsC (Cys-tRNA(Pro) deacylase)
MAESLSQKARRVQKVITDKGFGFNVTELPHSTRTAADAAEAVGCEIAQIAKSLVFMEASSDTPVLVIASGSNRVDLEKIKEATGKELIQASGKQVKACVGFAIGGVPPVGHDVALFTILDPDLKQYARIWAAAGTPNAVFELTPADLEPMTGGVWVELS